MRHDGCPRYVGEARTRARRKRARTGRGLWLCALLFMPASLSAQRLVGRAIESETNKPVPHVEVRLDNADGTVGRVITDSTGRFLLRVAAAGTYRLTTNHISFAPLKADIQLTAGDQIEVVLRLAVAATTLPAVEVIARSRAPDAYLERNGFYDRKAGRFGVFRTLDDIERRRPFTTSDMFQGVSGVRVIYMGLQGKDIRMTRGEDPNCSPRVLIDKVIVRRGGRASNQGEPILDALLQPQDIQGIEIYRSPAETPQEYGGNEVTCGVVLFWTKRGAAR
jgi:carboxypeptidase family protein